GLSIDIVFVFDLSQDLLDQILDGDDPCGTAVLVDDQRHAPATSLQADQNAVEAHRLGYQFGRGGQGADRDLIVSGRRLPEGVLDMDYTGDSVEIVLED